MVSRNDYKKKYDSSEHGKKISQIQQCKKNVGGGNHNNITQSLTIHNLGKNVVETLTLHMCISTNNTNVHIVIKMCLQQEMYLPSPHLSVFSFISIIKSATPLHRRSLNTEMLMVTMDYHVWHF